MRDACYVAGLVPGRPCRVSVLVDKHLVGGSSGLSHLDVLAYLPESFCGRRRYSQHQQAAQEADGDRGLMSGVGREPILASSCGFVSRQRRHDDT